MTACGTFLNREKSTFIPAYEINFLGFDVDSWNCTVQIPVLKWENFKLEAYEIIRRKKVPHKNLEKIRGRMCAFSLVVVNMRLYIRRVTEALKNPDAQFMVEVTESLKAELRTWVEAKYVTTKKSWLEPGLKPVRYTIWTDASSGAAGIKIQAKGIEETVYWSPEQFEQNDRTSYEDAIMLKEAYAVLYTLKTYGHLLKNSRVKFQQDNRAVSCSFVHGSKNSPALTNFIREIHEEGAKWNISMDMDWCPDHEQEADEASRTIDSKESVFRTKIFKEIEKLLNWEFSLDAFAGPDNRKCKNYISMRDTTDNWATDFFAQEDFKGETIWVFPPKPMENYAFQHLEKFGSKNRWAFVLCEFEIASPIWPIIRRDHRYLAKSWEAKDCPILFPTKVKTEGLGYWKKPTHMTVTVIVFDPKRDSGNSLKGQKDSTTLPKGADGTQAIDCRKSEKRLSKPGTSSMSLKTKSGKI